MRTDVLQTNDLIFDLEKCHTLVVPELEQIKLEEAQNLYQKHRQSRQESVTVFGTK